MARMGRVFMPPLRQKIEDSLDMTPSPLAMLERKPRHGTPCNRCGLCCVATLCDLAMHVFRNGAGTNHGPCPALAFDGSESRCRLITESPTPKHQDAALLLTFSARGCDARFNGEYNDVEFTARMNREDLQPDNAERLAAARALWGLS